MRALLMGASDKKKIGNPPAWMSKDGKQAWRDIAKGLGDSVYALDGLSMMLMCEAFSAAQGAAKDLASRGPLVQSRDRGLVKNPALQILRDAGATFRAFADAFGLTPGARRRLGIDLSEEADTGLLD
jgi:P27 family predicted phage terminase small subunit